MEKNMLSGNQQSFLDYVRIIAASFVLLGHSFFYFDLTIFKNEQFFPLIQDIGVVVFFLLSGFLFVYTMEQKYNTPDIIYSYRDFVLHKIKRIAKEYIPALLIIAAVDYISIRISGDSFNYINAYSFKHFLGNIFMLQNTATYYIPGLKIVPFGSARPLWTLSIEWWFYLIFGKIFIDLKSKKEQKLQDIIILGLLIIFPIEYLIGGRGNGLGVVFALGILAYYCSNRINKKAAMVLFPLSALLYIAYGILLHDAYTIYSFIILWLMLCTGVRSFSGNEHSPRRKIPAFLSASTFMLYLTHWSIIDMLIRLQFPVSGVVYLVFSVIVSIVLACIMYYIFGKKELLYLPLKFIGGK